LSKIYKEPLKLNNKKSNIPIKNETKTLTDTKEDMQMGVSAYGKIIYFIYR
jgi:hypothetical protein